MSLIGRFTSISSLLCMKWNPSLSFPCCLLSASPLFWRVAPPPSQSLSPQPRDWHDFSVSHLLHPINHQILGRLSVSWASFSRSPPCNPTVILSLWALGSCLDSSEVFYLMSFHLFHFSPFNPLFSQLNSWNDYEECKSGHIMAFLKFLVVSSSETLSRLRCQGSGLFLLLPSWYLIYLSWFSPTTLNFLL